MKPALLSLFLLFFVNLAGQTIKDVTIVIVPCKDGTLIIDGNTIGSVVADDASRQTVSLGEHYLQLKTTTEKFNLTITVDENTKGIIKLGCDNAVIPQGTRLIDKQVSLSGSLANNLEQNVIGLDKDDEIILNCSVLNKKGNATIMLTEYSSHRQIYRKEKFNIIENEKIKIPTRGVYSFTLYTDALFGKEAKLTIDRLPSTASSSTFNTTVKTIYDTTNVEVLNTIARVYSTTNNHGSKTSISINLPKNTSYWAYWIGVDQQAQDKMKDYTSILAQAGKFFTANPLILFGMNLIPSLPMLNTPATIGYVFTDSKNSQLYMLGQPFVYYTFKHADNITTDFSLVNGSFPDLVFNMRNKDISNGHDVQIRVVAFIVTSKLILEN